MRMDREGRQGVDEDGSMHQSICTHRVASRLEALVIKLEAIASRFGQRLEINDDEWVCRCIGASVRLAISNAVAVNSNPSQNLAFISWQLAQLHLRPVIRLLQFHHRPPGFQERPPLSSNPKPRIQTIQPNQVSAFEIQTLKVPRDTWQSQSVTTASTSAPTCTY